MSSKFSDYMRQLDASGTSHERELRDAFRAHLRRAAAQRLSEAVADEQRIQTAIGDAENDDGSPPDRPIA